jgi:hypothetical protein
MSSGGGEGQGWGQALPQLATISAGIMDHPLASPSFLTPIRSAPSSSDHPLATPPPPPPPPTPGDVVVSTTTSHPSRTTSLVSTTAAPVSAPPPISYSSQFTVSRSTSSSSSSFTNKTLDALADEFLSQPSYRTEQLGLEPLRKPNPLPSHGTELDRLRTLVERRAWGDVLRCPKGSDRLIVVDNNNNNIVVE